MDDGTGKAIPLRRSRAARVVGVRTGRWTERVAAAVSAVLEPPRQVWLAGLGGGALAWRGARAGWSRLVTEGGEVERWLRGSSATPEG
jgi:hypothetical protein